jgi:hypothetical protein
MTRRSSCAAGRPLRLVLLLAAILMSASVAFGSNRAMASQIAMPWNSYYTVWGHSAQVNVQGVVSFEAYPYTMSCLGELRMGDAS